MRGKIVFMGLFFLCVVLTFPHEETRSLTLSAEEIDTLIIECGGGFLHVKGIEGHENIDVSAEIVLEGKSEKKAQEFIQKNIKLSLEKKGNRAILISEIEQKFPLFSWSWKTEVINLTVYVPKVMKLNIDDGSGWIKVENTSGEVYIDDGSGEIEVVKVVGDIEIDDGSGEIHVLDVTGSVKIDDGSGEVVIEGASGDVYVDDGSGTVRVRDVGGNVTVSDGSGSIHIERVEGDFILKNDGSGSLRVKDIKGRIIK